jgi:hypothetical protein
LLQQSFWGNTLTKFYFACNSNSGGKPVYLIKNTYESQDDKITLANFMILDQKIPKWSTSAGGFYHSQIIRELSVPEIIAYRLRGILSAEDVQ